MYLFVSLLTCPPPCRWTWCSERARAGHVLRHPRYGRLSLRSCHPIQARKRVVSGKDARMKIPPFGSIGLGAYPVCIELVRHAVSQMTERLERGKVISKCRRSGRSRAG